MPLKEGSSDEVIAANIKELIAAGHDPKQAAAIAYKKAGRSRTEDGKGKHIHIFVDGSGPPRVTATKAKRR